MLSFWPSLRNIDPFRFCFFNFLYCASESHYISKRVCFDSNQCIVNVKIPFCWQSSTTIRTWFFFISSDVLFYALFTKSMWTVHIDWIFHDRHAYSAAEIIIQFCKLLNIHLNWIIDLTLSKNVKDTHGFFFKRVFLVFRFIRDCLIDIHRREIINSKLF